MASGSSPAEERHTASYGFSASRTEQRSAAYRNGG